MEDWTCLLYSGPGEHIPGIVMTIVLILFIGQISQVRARYTEHTYRFMPCVQRQLLQPLLHVHLLS